jgi:anaerobic ribonucleoside-triphosphate reductase activating protein
MEILYSVWRSKEMSDVLLNVSATMSRSRANGPGLRAVVWVQGCTIGCVGCYSSATHPHAAASLIRPAEISEWILSIPNIEGITFSGGEPFEQAAAVLETIRAVKQEKGPNFSVFVFTGFELEVLQRSEDDNVLTLLEYIDILSAGPYDYKLRDQKLLWRGSRNQSLHFLTQRYSSENIDDWIFQTPVEEITLTSDLINFTGFVGPNSKMLRAVEKIITTNS